MLIDSMASCRGAVATGLGWAGREWSSERPGRPARGQTAHGTARRGANSGVGALLVLECCRLADQSTMESCC